MISANQIKTGSVIDANGAPHIVENVVRQTPAARGAATLYKVRARHLLLGTKADLTCRGDDTFREPNFQTRETQFLYQDDDRCVFMDVESFDQYELGTEFLTEQLPFLVDDLEGIQALLLEERIIGVRLPPTVTLELVECDPAVKGASATARTKPATTQTGLTVQVPEYMQKGEMIRVDTSTGKLLSRA